MRDAVAEREIVGVVDALFDSGGGEMYFGESVTQRAHALQCAWLARRDEAPAALVVAALLHDVGHLLLSPGEDVADPGNDTRHEEAGSLWLARYCGPDVTEPARLHVDAKRYLCAHDPVYMASLSPASRQSLERQGGPFNPAEVREFVEQPYAREAVRLRRWDDRAKDPALTVPGLHDYADVLIAASAARHK
jgi:phosphonate degradation associated HDIG domain protein